MLEELEKIINYNYIYGFRLKAGLWIILIGRLVTEGHEPRQVRKEAAISDLFCVVDRSRSCNLPAPVASRIFLFKAPHFIS